MKKIISFILRNVPRKYIQRISGISLKIIGLFYKGDNVYCPINGKGYKKFLPYGRVNPRENALCPDTLSLERHRLIWLYLKEKTNFFESKLKVLHVAPEQCFMDRFEKLHGDDYITADIESPLAKVKMDIHDIPFPANTFDVVFCNHVMEHVEDDIKAMSELYRVLKPGGWGILQIPFFEPVPEKTFEDNSITDPKEREKIFGQDDHVRLYGKDYPDRLRKAGFKVTEDNYVNELPEYRVKKYALPKGELIYKVEK
ncbi:methyltransferase domain-containing protein [Marivirga salinae]|uniref:Methyltransferase domain-containing protein n=1 Tax=Marivirga salinarum TaxID=3059078 RepID=A0AA51NC90_9BACT|nr:methyltransferase domain-containing protein [Marivirga sp. BDSF4-3]WMN12727.1 methyltransferase domain-containing protein [Marivirga sp. BDSF4-3]